uniref:hypothetical protein n=1 Tax=Candidatus Electronema sp. TaxID=2698783 RepID=UPI004057A38C
MWDWIIANKDWLFEGIGVVALVAAVGWLWPKKGKDEAGTHSLHQTNVNGDNVGRDKNVNR